MGGIGARKGSESDRIKVIKVKMAELGMAVSFLDQQKNGSPFPRTCHPFQDSRQHLLPHLSR
jgi:hypothetical protein